MASEVKTSERTRRADDRRNSGLGDNVRFTVSVQDTNGAGPNLFNDRTRGTSEKNGKGKRAVS